MEIYPIVSLEATLKELQRFLRYLRSPQDLWNLTGEFLKNLPETLLPNAPFQDPIFSFVHSI